MKKESTPGGGCSAGEEIDTSQQRDTRELYIIVEEREREREEGKKKRNERCVEQSRKPR